MKLRIIKMWETIFLDLGGNGETYTALALSKRGITKAFVLGRHSSLSTENHYIADEEEIEVEE
ncbi:hypothetical protein LCGC14_1947350 [marine sediment metagenome]|uniref:Uncharacterized protein n=1 Tax=marine sediment metagenome TaxID=412755 RepID=A0A0F9G6X4_9ZZZZ